MKKTKSDKKVTYLVLAIAILSLFLILDASKKPKITISPEEVKLDPNDPCKDAFSIARKSLFFVREPWLPKNESEINCNIGYDQFEYNLYRDWETKVNMGWTIDGVRFHYETDINNSGKCKTTFFFNGYPERKMPYPNNLTEQFRFLSKFIDLSYFCFDKNKTHFFADDFDGSTELYNLDGSIWLARSRQHRYPENEEVYMSKLFSPSECLNPLIADVPVKDYSKNKTCLNMGVAEKELWLPWKT